MTELRRLGRSGLAVSTVGLGCNNLGRSGTASADEAGSRAVVEAALDAGITLFDTADVYGSEPGVSETLLGRSLGRHRAEVVVATKFGLDARGANGRDDGARGSRRYLHQAVEASLRRLGTDWIDLYQFHAPDPATPVAETLEALDDLVSAGKVRYVGHSQFSAWQAVDADWAARGAGTVRFVSTQSEYSLLQRGAEAELLPALDHLGVGLLPFFPLANGLLTGKYRRGDAPAGSRLASIKPELLASRRGTPWTRSTPSPVTAASPCSTWPSAGCWPTRRWVRSSPGPPGRSRCARTSPRPPGDRRPATRPRSTRSPPDPSVARL